MSVVKLVFNNLDKKRLLLLAEAEIVLMKAGVTFNAETSSDRSQRVWVIDDEAEGVELKEELVSTTDYRYVEPECTCPCMLCDKELCPHRQNPYWVKHLYKKEPFTIIVSEANGTWKTIYTNNTEE